MTSFAQALWAPLATALRAYLAPWRLWRDLRQYHAYHGPWALGVRLLRRWSIRSKVLLLLALIMLPLLPLTAHVVRSSQLTVDSARTQLAAVRAADAGARLAAELGTQRRAIDAGKAPDLERLERAHDEFLEALGRHNGQRVTELAEGAEALRQVARAAAERGLTGPARADAMARALQALLALREIGNLTLTVSNGLDPHVNRTASLGVLRLPELQLAVGRLGEGLARQARLRSGDAASRPTVALQEAAVDTAGQLQLALHLASALASELSALAGERGDAPMSIDQTRRLLAAAKASLLAGDAAEDPVVLARNAEAARKELAELRASLVEQASTHLDQQLREAQRERNWVLSLLAGCLLVAAYLGYTFFLVMKGGLDALNFQMKRMASGDLSARPKPLGRDEVAETMRAMTASLARLSDLLASVRHGVGAVTQAAQQVALGNGELATRTRADLQALDGVVGSVQRYSLQLEAAGREVELVVGIVQELRLDALRNRKQTQRLQEQMTSLRQRSREIADIVRLIDGIAFRTNILSLNAQVEASKAGDAGRGFAVVAQEVRSLALRSADSARRIDEIVVRSTEDIERSGALADETGKALEALDAHVDRIDAAMKGVSELTRNGEKESTAILDEVKNLKEGSGQNLKLVDQLAGAADSLRSQGVKLSQSIAQFTLA